jgi:hypothetical protein
MIDEMTKKPIKVTGIGLLSAWIRLPASQIPAVTALLDANGVPYLVGEEFLSINDGPETGSIHLDRTRDAPRVQQLLDSVP